MTDLKKYWIHSKGVLNERITSKLYKIIFKIYFYWVGAPFGPSKYFFFKMINFFVPFQGGWCSLFQWGIRACEKFSMQYSSPFIYCMQYSSLFMWKTGFNIIIDVLKIWLCLSVRWRKRAPGDVNAPQSGAHLNS